MIQMKGFNCLSIFFKVLIILQAISRTQSFHRQYRVNKLRDNCGEMGLEPPRMFGACKKFEAKTFPNGNWETRGLVGLPGSGLPWFLHLISQSSGVMNRMLEPSVPPSHVPGLRCALEYSTGQTPIAGTFDVAHTLFPEGFRKEFLVGDEGELPWEPLSKKLFNYRGIILVRNPWNVIPNMRLDILKMAKVGKLPGKNVVVSRDLSLAFENKDFQRFFEAGAKVWVTYIKTWLENSSGTSDTIVVKYEDLMRNRRVELERVLNYLNVTQEDERVTCALNEGFTPLQFVSTWGSRSEMSNFFLKNLDATGSQIIQEGMVEINQLLSAKGFHIQLNYSRPSNSEFLNDMDAFMMPGEL